VSDQHEVAFHQVVSRILEKPTGGQPSSGKTVIIYGIYIVHPVGYPAESTKVVYSLFCSKSRL